MTAYIVHVYPIYIPIFGVKKTKLFLDLVGVIPLWDSVDTHIVMVLLLKWTSFHLIGEHKEKLQIPMLPSLDMWCHKAATHEASPWVAGVRCLIITDLQVFSVHLRPLRSNVGMPMHFITARWWYKTCSDPKLYRSKDKRNNDCFGSKQLDWYRV